MKWFAIKKATPMKHGHNIALIAAISGAVSLITKFTGTLVGSFLLTFIALVLFYSFFVYTKNININKRYIFSGKEDSEHKFYLRLFKIGIIVVVLILGTLLLLLGGFIELETTSKILFYLLRITTGRNSLEEDAEVDWWYYFSFF